MCAIWQKTSLISLTRRDPEWLIARLTAATELAAKNKVQFPNESSEYQVMLVTLCWPEEIELRRHIERVAALRRSLPLGGKISKTIRSKERMVLFASDLFGDKQASRPLQHDVRPATQKRVPHAYRHASPSGDGTARNLRERAPHRHNGSFANRAASSVRGRNEAGGIFPLYSDTKGD